MPEFTTGNVLLPQLPPSIEEIKARVAVLRKSSQERQEQIDQTFIDVTKSLTNIDLTDPIAAGRRAESLGGGAIGPEGILIDQLFTSSTAGGADLPPGVGANGKPLPVNQNQPTEYTLDSAGNLVQVQMLPMWTADP